MQTAENKHTNTVKELLISYGYAERQSLRDVKELATALLTDPLTKQHAFELILGRPVPVLEIANDKSLLAIWNSSEEPKTTIQNLELQRSVEAIAS